tara:strand:+ start:639 stop:893 length:255 start_codon:yes stop_codon:yes gene_type:complete
MDELKIKIKQQLIEQLNLEDMEVSDIEDDAPLFSAEGLGLDSIDALEIIVLLEANYGIKLKDPEAGKEVFFSVSTLAKYITANA